MESSLKPNLLDFQKGKMRSPNVSYLVKVTGIQTGAETLTQESCVPAQTLLHVNSTLILFNVYSLGNTCYKSPKPMCGHSEVLLGYVYSLHIFVGGFCFFFQFWKNL